MKREEFYILVIDDEPALATLLAEELELEGFKVFKAHSGKEGFEIFKANPFIKLIFSDIKMNFGNGVWILERIKEMNQETPPLFLLSGYSDYTEEEVCNLGAAGLIKKPFDLEEILQITVGEFNRSLS